MTQFIAPNSHRGAGIGPYGPKATINDHSSSSSLSEVLSTMTLDKKKSNWLKIIDNPKLNAYVYKLNNDIIGFMVFGSSRERSDSDTGELIAIYFDPDYWGNYLCTQARI